MRAFGHLVLAAGILAAGAVAAWLLVEAASNYGGDCWDGERQAYQLALSALALAAAASAGVGLYCRWRRRAPAWLLGLSLPILVFSGWFAVLLVGCGG